VYLIVFEVQCLLYLFAGAKLDYHVYESNPDVKTPKEWNYCRKRFSQISKPWKGWHYKTKT